jgi:hypothetical protein
MFLQNVSGVDQLSGDLQMTDLLSEIASDAASDSLPYYYYYYYYHHHHPCELRISLVR